MSTPRLAVLALVVTAAVLVPYSAETAAAQSDPYAADPLYLVPFANTVQRVYSRGVDTWEVWECHVPNWSDTFDVASVTASLNGAIGDYFIWLSQGLYLPQFVVGGEVTSSDVIPTDITSREGFRAAGCESAVKDAKAAAEGAGTSPTSNGALIVIAGGFNEGYGTAGSICPEDPFTGCATTYPDNARIAVVGAAAVHTVPPFTEPQWITVAHELGHGLDWPHSYGGLNSLASGQVDAYDNPMDMMSGETITGDPVGTIAYNRYSAGWISPSQVIVHRSGVATYTLGGIGAGGTQMLILPIETGHFYALDARRLSSFDSSLPKAGVEVYEIDQRRATCSLGTVFPPSTYPTTADWPCFATLVRIAQTPAVPGINGTAHVLSIDQWVDLGFIKVTVIAADTNTFTVRVEDTRVGNRFVDDDGNIHEANIEAIAAAGITQGCNPPLDDRYCPSRPVSRAEMAVFLVSALGMADNLPTYEGTFSDVAPGAWYTPYVERLAELGITAGYPDGTYRPADTVTRAQMATFLAVAFDHTGERQPATGVFTDVGPSAWYASDVELAYRLGITSGCGVNPLRYCPDNPVLRDQMATFLATALGLTG
jgi:M6 family metalloprotease-like protein